MRSHISLEEARGLVEAEVRALLERRGAAAESVALEEALGRVLAADVLADRDQPAFDRSAMDGYAVRSADVGEAGAWLEVIGEAQAGGPFEGTVGAGQAVAIMTGAPVPAGADAVQMIENVREEGGPEGVPRVHVAGPLAVGRHVARRGEDVRTGDVVAPAGRRVAGLVAGVLGSVGAARVAVRPRPRVVILATGDELVDVSETPGPSQIRDSNRHTLSALARAAGAQVVDARRVADSLEALDEAIAAGLGADVLVLSGGVSAGRYDLVLEALQARGVEHIFHKIAVKPGKPVLFGRHAGGLVFGLPGNPVSTWVTGALLVAPALARLGGQADPGPWTVQAPLRGALGATGGRATLHPARLVGGDGGRASVEVCGWNGSGDQVGYAQARCLIHRPAGAGEAVEGELVDVVLLGAAAG